MQFPTPTAAVAARRRHLPWCTLLLCAATAVMSYCVAVHISGPWLGHVRVVDLEPWGLRFHHLREVELWRLVTALMHPQSECQRVTSTDGPTFLHYLQPSALTHPSTQPRL